MKSSFALVSTMFVAGLVTMAVISTDAHAAPDAPAVQPEPASLQQWLQLRPGARTLAAWNTNGNIASEAHRGYLLPQPMAACGGQNTRAFANLASSDYQNLRAPGGAAEVHPAGSPVGFRRLRTAMEFAGRRLDELVLHIEPMQLQSAEQVPASFQPEKRVYRGGRFMIKFAGERLMVGQTPDLTMTIDYRDPANCGDDRISGRTGAAVLQDDSAQSSVLARSIAAAFSEDVRGRRVRLDFQSVQPAVQNVQLNQGGRVGAFFTIGNVNLKVVE